MKALNLALFSFVLLSTLDQAWSDLSVWDAAKENSYMVEGQIKTISINEDSQQVTIRVQTSDEATETRTLRVCNHDAGSDTRNWQQAEKMNLLRQAFNQGDRVKVSYGGPFNPCLSSVSFTSKAVK